MTCHLSGFVTLSMSWPSKVIRYIHLGHNWILIYLVYACCYKPFSCAVLWWHRWYPLVFQVKLDLNDEIVNSNKNYYRPLSHISNHPLKSSSNGSPIASEDHTTEMCKSIDSMQTNSLTGGEVLIELDFNFRKSQFVIVLRQCRNLPQVDGVSNTICP